MMKAAEGNGEVAGSADETTANSNLLDYFCLHPLLEEYTGPPRPYPNLDHASLTCPALPKA